MKKLIALASAVAVTATAALAINWDTVENLAKGATVTVSSSPTTAANITDGNTGTDWQAAAATHSDAHHDWVLIDLGEAKTFSFLETTWERSLASKYSVYVSNTEFTINEVNVGTEEAPVLYNEIDLTDMVPVKTGTVELEEGATKVTSELYLGQQTAQYVLVYADEYNSWGRDYGIRLYEVRLANVENPDKIDHLDVKVEADGIGVGEETTVNVSAATLVGSADINDVTGLTLSAAPADGVEITPAAEYGAYTVKGLKSGTYTLTAKGSVNGDEVSGTAQFKVKYEFKGENAANGKTVTARTNADAEVTNPGTNAVDGNIDTFYDYNGGWSEAWVIVDLGSEYIISEVAAQFADKSGGNFKFSFASADATMPAADDNWKNDLPDQTGWTTTANIDRASFSTIPYIPETPIRARYVAYRDFDCPDGNARLAELYIAGEVYENPELASIEVNAVPSALFIGETADVTVTGKDQYGADFEIPGAPVITVEGPATYADGKITATAKGTVTVKAAVEDITSSVSFNVADVEDYCMAGAVVTSDNAEANGNAAIDGGKEPAAPGEQYVVNGGEPAGEHEHWILAELAKPYDLDMIVAGWEGACPADYKVFVGADKDNLREVGSVTGHPGMHAEWDRFAAPGMSDVKFIKIVTSKNATGYGIKLYDLKAYGTSDAVAVATSVVIETSDPTFVSGGEKVAFTAMVFDQYGVAMDDAAAQIFADGEILADGVLTTADVKTTYNVVAKYDDIESDPVAVSVVALEQDWFGPTEYIATFDGETHENNLIGKNEGVMAQEWTDEDLDKGLVLKMTDNDGTNWECDLDMIKLFWEAACPESYSVTVEDKNGNKQTVDFAGRTFAGGYNPVDRIVDLGSDAPSYAPARVSQQVTNNVDLGHVHQITVTVKNHASQYGSTLYGLSFSGKAEEGMPTTVVTLVSTDANAPVDVFTVSGILVRHNVKAAEALTDLPKGIYIVNGKKVVK